MSGNSFSFAVASLLKMRRCLGSHAIPAYQDMLHAFSPWCHMLELFYMHLHSNEKPFMHVVIEYLTTMKR